MVAIKERNNDEKRTFQREWTERVLFVYIEGAAVCFVMKIVSLE
jgi:hypothetical protein